PSQLSATGLIGEAIGQRSAFLSASVPTLSAGQRWQPYAVAFPFLGHGRNDSGEGAIKPAASNSRCRRSPSRTSFRASLSKYRAVLAKPGRADGSAEIRLRAECPYSWWVWVMSALLMALQAEGKPRLLRPVAHQAQAK